jgi:hypothetical protein
MSDLDPHWQPMGAGPVGGFVVPANEIQLFAPWIGLTVVLAAVSLAVLKKSRIIAAMQESQTKTT